MFEDKNFELMFGDCYELIKTLDKGSFDLVVTDPPYKIGNVNGGGIYKLVEPDAKDNPYKGKNTNTIHELEKLDSTDFHATPFLELIQSKMNVFYGYFFCNKILVPEYLNFATKNKYVFDILFIYKESPVPARNGHHLPDTEYCILIRESGSFFSKEAGFDDYKKKYSVTLDGKKKLHPAEKPVEFLESFIRVSCPENKVVLDTFMGSGSTGIAALKNNRKFIGIEKNPKYFELAKNRIENFRPSETETIKEVDYMEAQQLELF